jgi:hypothetical protein
LAVLADDNDVGGVMPKRLALVILTAARQVTDRLQPVQRAVPEVLQVQDRVVGEQVTQPIPVTIVCHVPVQSDHVVDRQPVLGGDIQHRSPSSVGGELPVSSV